MWINFSFRKTFWLFFFVFSLIKRDIWHLNRYISSWPDQIRPCDAGIKLHQNFRNFCFQVSFSQNFQLAASLFYLIIRNFRPKGCCCFYSVSFKLYFYCTWGCWLRLMQIWWMSGKSQDQLVSRVLILTHRYCGQFRLSWGRKAHKFAIKLTRLIRTPVNPLTTTCFHEFNKSAYCSKLVISNPMCSKNTQLTESKKQHTFGLE